MTGPASIGGRVVLPLPPAPAPGPMEARLREQRDSGRKLLVPYLTGGLGPWTELIRAMADAGADAIEAHQLRSQVCGTVKASNKCLDVLF